MTAKCVNAPRKACTQDFMPPLLRHSLQNLVQYRYFKLANVISVWILSFVILPFMQVQPL